MGTSYDHPPNPNFLIIKTCPSQIYSFKIMFFEELLVKSDKNKANWKNSKITNIIIKNKELIFRLTKTPEPPLLATQ